MNENDIASFVFGSVTALFAFGFVYALYNIAKWVGKVEGAIIDLKYQKEDLKRHQDSIHKIYGDISRVEDKVKECQRKKRN